LLELRIAERAGENERAVGDATGGAAIGALMRVGERDARSHPGWGALLIEFRVVAAREPTLNQRYAVLHARTIDGLTELLTRASCAPARLLAEVVLGFASAVVLERAVNPRALPTAAVEALFARALS
jgi:hypothetical protein